MTMRQLRPRLTRVLRWLAEIAGVAAIAIAAALWWLPLGIAIVGVYLVVIGNIESGGDGNARTQDSST